MTNDILLGQEIHTQISSAIADIRLKAKSIDELGIACQNLASLFPGIPAISNSDMRFKIAETVSVSPDSKLISFDLIDNGAGVVRVSLSYDVQSNLKQPYDEVVFTRLNDNKEDVTLRLLYSKNKKYLGAHLEDSNSNFEYIAPDGRAGHINGNPIIHLGKVIQEICDPKGLGEVRIDLDNLLRSALLEDTPIAYQTPAFIEVMKDLFRKRNKDDDIARDALFRLASQLNHRSPYPQLLKVDSRGFSQLNNEAKLKVYTDPPVLYDPVIWNTGTTPQGEPIPYDPMYWDQETNFLDPREVESELTNSYGSEGLRRIKTFMIEAALLPENQRLMRKMKYPMRVPQVLMRLANELLFDPKFKVNAKFEDLDLMTVSLIGEKVIKAMSFAYRLEADVLKK